MTGTEEGSEPAALALTDQHVKALERAIRAQDFRIMVEAETGRSRWNAINQTR